MQAATTAAAVATTTITTTQRSPKLWYGGCVLTGKGPRKIFENTGANLCIFGDQCNIKCTTQHLINILGDQFDDIGSSKVARINDTFKSDMAFTAPAA